MSKPTYDELEAQLADAKAELDAGHAPGQDAPGALHNITGSPVLTGPVEEVDAEVVHDPAPAAEAVPPTPKSLPSDWPSKGYTGPQPWEVEEPPALLHGHGLLIVGSAGDDVRVLCALLAYAGYPTDVSEGTNPLSIFDGSVKAAVSAFRRDYGVQEDPAIISASTSDVAGPWTWAALYRIARRRAA